MRTCSRARAWGPGSNAMPWWNALFVDPVVPRDGVMHMSAAPGLGLTLDERAVAKYAAKP